MSLEIVRDRRLSSLFLQEVCLETLKEMLEESSEDQDSVGGRKSLLEIQEERICGSSEDFTQSRLLCISFCIFAPGSDWEKGKGERQEDKKKR